MISPAFGAAGDGVAALHGQFTSFPGGWADRTSNSAALDRRTKNRLFLALWHVRRARIGRCHYLPNPAMSEQPARTAEWDSNPDDPHGERDQRSIARIT
jgi:hypothetical protein